MSASRAFGARAVHRGRRATRLSGSELCAPCAAGANRSVTRVPHEPGVQLPPRTAAHVFYSHGVGTRARSRGPYLASYRSGSWASIPMTGRTPERAPAFHQARLWRIPEAVLRAVSRLIQFCPADPVAHLV